MSRRNYVISFLILSFTFVPVLFSWFPAVSMTGPCSYIAYITLFNTASYLFQKEWEEAAFESINLLFLAFYLGLFYLLARFTFLISQRDEKPTAKIAFQIICLLILFACSFLRVIQGSSFVNWTGAYNFWTGCLRFWETR